MNYLPTTFEIKKAEMLALVTRHLRLSGDAKIPVFNETHSQARSVMGVKDVLLKYTLKDFMLFLLHRPSELQKYQKPKQDVLAAQMTIRGAIAAGRYNSETEVKILEEWFASMLPERGLDRQFIPLPDRRRVLTALVANPELVFSSCPAIQAENLLSRARADALNHDPELSDAIDLMHSVPALAYCDVFVSNDKFVRSCSKFVLERTRRRVVVARSLSEALQGLGSRPFTD